MKTYDADITITLHGQLHNVEALNMFLAKTKINRMATADILAALQILDRDTVLTLNDCILMESNSSAEQSIDSIEITDTQTPTNLIDDSQDEKFLAEEMSVESIGELEVVTEEDKTDNNEEKVDNTSSIEPVVSVSDTSWY